MKRVLLSSELISIAFVFIMIIYQSQSDLCVPSIVDCRLIEMSSER